MARLIPTLSELGGDGGLMRESGRTLETTGSQSTWISITEDLASLRYRIRVHTTQDAGTVTFTSYIVLNLEALLHQSSPERMFSAQGWTFELDEGRILSCHRPRTRTRATLIASMLY